ncbi:MAG: tRNA uridine-5-carboxymethylaminomethyl(34) synthesis GTPase MnmE, partial [Oscillospiraceae bacterium]|nr:tRNA uridine-5-carboxymethylaminomethyl(34) synthesis GTPase MnmE [Oscillospiraceae bacterium]
MASTIAAISTAPMKSAIGIIRISGDDALAVSEKVFSGNIRKAPREMVTGSFLTKSGEVLDYGMGVFFKGPKSFTGEDSVEFYCHGSTAVLSAVLSEVFSAGARPAEAGEFTRRAFLNGKMDLTQAEAVIDLIDSECTLAAKNAAEQMNGALGREISEISAELTAIAAEFYAFIDYPDDEIEQTDRMEISEKLFAAAKRAQKLSGTYAKGHLLRDGVKVALIGRPNVGKSSLLNAILGTDRAIVTDVEGTTRDTVEESLTINGVALHLIDTAGFRNATGEPERLGIERSRKAAEEADLILAVFDGSEEFSGADEEVLHLAKGKHSICIINKSDLPQKLSKDAFSNLSTIELSAKKKTGTEELCDRISELLGTSDIPCDGKVVTNPRHASTLSRAEQAITSAAEAFSDGTFPDIAVCDVENAISILGELTGHEAQEA